MEKNLCNFEELPLLNKKIFDILVRNMNDNELWFF